MTQSAFHELISTSKTVSCVCVCVGGVGGGGFEAEEAAVKSHSNRPSATLAAVIGNDHSSAEGRAKQLQQKKHTQKKK